MEQEGTEGVSMRGERKLREEGEKLGSLWEQRGELP